VVAAAPEKLRRTPLFDRHQAAGARLVPFAGWEMPVQYAGVREEHLAVRERAGVFDVSHMGEVETHGPGALDFLQRMLSNDVSKITVGGAQYSVLCREDGGVLDDLFTYRLAEDRFLTVTNAANHAKDLAWLRTHAAGFEVELVDRLDDYAMLAVQGPAARSLVAPLLGDGEELPARFRAAELHVAARRRSCVGPATRARTAWSSCAPPPARQRSGTRCSPPASSRPGWPRATRCGWRRASTSTATT
jgi:aminomethyltransferase